MPSGVPTSTASGMATSSMAKVCPIATAISGSSSATRCRSKAVAPSAGRKAAGDA